MPRRGRMRKVERVVASHRVPGHRVGAPGGKGGTLRGELARKPFVVVVEERDQLAARVLDTEVAGGGGGGAVSRDAQIADALLPSLPSAQASLRVVGRAVVADEHLEGSLRLGEHRAQRSLAGIGALVGGDDDADRVPVGVAQRSCSVGISAPLLYLCRLKRWTPGSGESSRESCARWCERSAGRLTDVVPSIPGGSPRRRTWERPTFAGHSEQRGATMLQSSDELTR